MRKIFGLARDSKLFPQSFDITLQLFFRFSPPTFQKKKSQRRPTQVNTDHILLNMVNYYIFQGFFSTGDEITPGNNGMKDVVMSLRWVQKNIHHFGGNPTKVTIYGSSAGAAIVNYLLLSPISEGIKL